MSGEQVPDVWPAGTEVQAMYNFEGTSVEDLPFQKRDALLIRKPTKDPNWYYAKHLDPKDHAKVEGMIPANYVAVKKGAVKLHAMPWFHGKMKREQAEDLLMPRENGLFLVRESNNFPGDYALCVCCDDKVEHYHILLQVGKLTIDSEVFFDTLNQLVEHYIEDADGLCTNLKKPLAKKGNLDYSVDAQSFYEEGWVLNKTYLTIGDSIGKGEFGDVLKGEYNGRKVAIKSLKDSSKAAQQFLAEAQVMTALQHPNLIQLLGVVLGETIYIVTEFASKGSLVDYLRSRGRSIIQQKDQIHFATDTAKGMAYLEEQRIVHRDLAARNVLIAEDGSAKVSDFGLARFTNHMQEGGVFPIKWTAPEALRESKFTSKSDMWSFGILLWEVYSFGRVPYPRIPLADVVQHVERGYRMEAPDGCPKDIYTIMQEAWDIKPDKRPSFLNVASRLIKVKSTTV